jgi:hypothetical protein
MARPKVLYWLFEKDHRRVYLPIQKDDRLEQKIAVHRYVSTKGLNFETYTYDADSSIIDIVHQYKPDIFIQCTSSFDIPMLKANNIKHGYINHGFWPKSPNNINKSKDKFWNNFDLLCGASNIFREIFETCSSSKALIKINTLTQFDILYNCVKNKENLKKEIIQNSKNKDAKKLITLFSHYPKNRKSLNPYNYGYYKSAIELAKISEKYNYLLVIKLKRPEYDIDGFLLQSNEKWAKDIFSEYNKLKNNKYIKFVHYDENAYDYFSSDLIVNSARSTIEVEAAIANVPVISLRAPDREPDGYSYMYESGVLDFNATYICKDINDLHDMAQNALNGNNDELFNNQNKFKDHLGIIFDGNANKRVIEAILEVLGK